MVTPDLYGCKWEKWWNGTEKNATEYLKFWSVSIHIWDPEAG